MVLKIYAKSILNRHRRRDEWFLDDYSVNPYSGCSFKCIYCYIRGSKYGGGTDGNLGIKVNAVEILEKQLRRRAMKKEYGIIALSTSTEPYQRIEEKLKLTRKILEVILKYRFPVHILTKSDMILRDLDLLKEVDEKAILPDDLQNRLEHGLIINFSISTLDEKLARILEPGAPQPEKRLETMSKCEKKGFLTGISYIPLLPYISDSEEELGVMVKTAKDYGAKFIFAGALTLFGDKQGDCKTLYYEFLKKYYPELLSRYRALYRIFPQPAKEYQEIIEKRARELCERYDVKYKLIT